MFFISKDEVVNFLSKKELLLAIDSGKSLLRIGDGEIGLVHFSPIHYQVWSPEIRNEFIKIIKNYTSQSSYILGIPIFAQYSLKQLDLLPNNLQPSRSKKFVWFPLKITYELIFNKDAYYFDQHIFYKFNTSKEILEYVISKRKNIMFVSDKSSIKEVRDNVILKDKINFYVETPSENSFEMRASIESKIREAAEKSRIKKQDLIIIFKGGLAKTIIYDLSKEYQILDIGKGFESLSSDKDLEWVI